MAVYNAQRAQMLGKLADIAVFDKDLVELGRSRPAELLEAKVLYTIAGGRIVHEAGGAGAGRR